jgi:DNA-binding response OmpR family regulator
MENGGKDMSSKLRILAVDDNVVNLATLEQELKGKYDVTPMSSGGRAVRVLRREEVDLILLDIEMPDMDGLDTLREIRTIPGCATIPVIFLTANNDKATVVEGMKLGIMDYVVKPYKATDLNDRIERCLKRRGTIPIDAKELHQRLLDLEDLMRTNNVEGATAKATEIMGYKMDEEIAGRVSVVKAKLDEGDLTAAEVTLSRVLKLLEQKEDVTSTKKSRFISKADLNIKLRYTINALANFQTREAVDKIGELLSYDLPAGGRQRCEKALEALQGYDDEAAEKLLQEVVDSLR